MSINSLAGEQSLGECPLVIRANLFSIGAKPLARLKNNQEYQEKVKEVSNLQEVDVDLELLQQTDKRCTYQGPATVDGRIVDEIGQVRASIYIKQYGGEEPSEGEMLNLQFVFRDTELMMFIAVKEMSAHSLQVIGYSVDETKNLYTSIARSTGSNQQKIERVGFTNYRIKAL